MMHDPRAGPPRSSCMGLYPAIFAVRSIVTDVLYGTAVGTWAVGGANDALARRAALPHLSG